MVNKVKQNPESQLRSPSKSNHSFPVLKSSPVSIQTQRKRLRLNGNRASLFARKPENVPVKSEKFAGDFDGRVDVGELISESVEQVDVSGGE